MARRTPPRVLAWPAPMEGVVRSTALAYQPPRSAINALNVRNRDPKDWRLRICRRAGLSKWIVDPVEAEGLPVQDIAFLNLNVNPVGADLTIPGAPATDDPLFDPPLGGPPFDGGEDPMPDTEPQEPEPETEVEPEPSEPDEVETTDGTDGGTSSSGTSSSEDVSSSEDLGPCHETCADDVEVWLLIDPSTEVRPYCLACIGSNDYGNVYAASYMVTYMDGVVEVTSLVYMRMELVGVAVGSEEFVKWRLGLFLTNMGVPASDPEVRLETNLFDADVEGITGPPYCPDEAPDSTPALNQFLDIIRDDDSPLADSTHPWGAEDDVRFEPNCVFDCGSDPWCETYLPDTLTLTALLINASGTGCENINLPGVTLTRDSESPCAYGYTSETVGVSLAQFCDVIEGDLWLLAITLTGPGKTLIARKAFDSQPFGEYEDISVNDCDWDVPTLEVS